MTILIEAEAKEIAELLTLLTPKERQIMNIRYPDKCNNRMYSPSETKEKAATETAKEVKLEIWDGANWGRREHSTN